MTDYHRPPLDLGVFRDEHGIVIPYGRRWEDQDGPDDTYSVAAHPERFAPLQDVGRGLLDHLTTTYDVTVDVLATTHRLTPRRADAATLSMTFTDAPGLTCSAGVSTTIAYFCGCDHCDEDVTVLAGELEDEIGAVVGGRFREWLSREDDGELWEWRELLAPDGGSWHSGGGTVTGGRADVAALQQRYATVPARWAAWDLREET